MARNRKRSAKGSDPTIPQRYSDSSARLAYKIQDGLFSRAINRQVIGSIQQFFIHKGDNKPSEPLGSCVFIKYKGYHFLITAAHVLEKDYNEAYLRLGSDDLRPGGEIFFSELPSGMSRDDDFIDIGVIRLDDKTMQILQDYKAVFITEDRFAIGYQPQPNDRNLLCGFPASVSKKLQYKKYREGFALVTEPIIDNNVYRTHKVDEDSNILLAHDRMGVVKADNVTPHQSVDLHGVSGGGVWKATYLEGGVRLDLAGIITTSLDPAPLLVVTRIDTICRFIDDSYSLAEH